MPGGTTYEKNVNWLKKIQMEPTIFVKQVSAPLLIGHRLQTMSSASGSAHRLHSHVEMCGVELLVDGSSSGVVLAES